LDKALKTPGEEARAEYRMILPDGSVKWAFSRGKTTLLRDGTVELRGITTDITSIKKIEDKLKSHIYQIEQMNKVMSNREIRIIEMKREVNKLLSKLGLEKKYAVD
jgi:PAS domain-containing protein